MAKRVCALLALLACSVAAAADDAACGYSEEPLPSATPVAQSRVKLLGMNPPLGAPVGKDTVIGIDVEFQMARFEPEARFLMVLFPTLDGSSTGPGDHVSSPPLKSAAGRIHLCVPLAPVYENDDVRWPLGLIVMLLEMSGSRGSATASTDKMMLNTVDPPARALAPRADGPAEKFGDSVTGAADFFANRRARYKVCIAGFPDLQPKLTRAYRSWESRHRADIEMVAESRFALDKARAKDRADLAVAKEDAQFEGRLESYRARPRPALRQECEEALAELSDGEDPVANAIGDYLEFIKRYRAEHPRAGTP